MSRGIGSGPPRPLVALALGLVLALCAVLSLCGIVAGQARAAEGEACPNEQLRSESKLNQLTGVPYSEELPECRAYEMVSPLEKGQATVNPAGGGGLGAQPFQQAAANGEGIMYGTTSVLPGGLSSPLNIDNVAFLEGEGWSTTPLTAPQLVPRTGAEEQSPFGYVRYLSPNLSCAIEESDEPMGSLSAQEGGTVEDHLYAWSRVDDSFTPISSGASSYEAYGAAEDCSHVVFVGSGNELYEWDEGTVGVVSVLPDGVAAAVLDRPQNNASDDSIVGAVSGDASRIFFDAKSNEGADSGDQEVFVREGGARTVEASLSQTATPDEGAEFQAASSDGSQVFFLANYGLASSSSTGATKCSLSVGGDKGCDLYDYDTEGHMLTDLSADTNPTDAEGADVQGVLGVASDGSYVYFSALGELLAGTGGAGEQAEALNQSREEANVYVWHDGQLKYIATITSKDESSGSDDLVNRSEQLGSRVTPSGQELLFTSTREITGYHNTTPIGTSAQEQFLYSAPTGEVVCISCDPDGARPLASAPTTIPGYNYGYSPRNVSEDGDRVFFTSEDPLTPGASHERNAYEWVREGTGECTAQVAHEASEYSGGCIYLLAAGGTVLDASSSGNDVFVTSRFPLVAQDEDGLADVYDVRVDGGFAAPTSASCAGEECQGELNQALSFTQPGSTGAPLVGNAPPPTKVAPKKLTRAQRLTKALAACRRRPRGKRAACRREARHRYGAKARKRARKPSKGKNKRSSVKGGK